MHTPPQVYIYEAILFLLLYIMYIGIVVALVYLYPWLKVDAFMDVIHSLYI